MTTEATDLQAEVRTIYREMGWKDADFTLKNTQGREWDNTPDPLADTDAGRAKLWHILEWAVNQDYAVDLRKRREGYLCAIADYNATCCGPGCATISESLLRAVANAIRARKESE